MAWPRKGLAWLRKRKGLANFGEKKRKACACGRCLVARMLGGANTDKDFSPTYYCSRQLNNLRQKCIISAVAETPSRFFSISKGITEIYRMKQIANAVNIYKSPMRSHLKYTGGSTSAQFNCAFLYICSTFVFTSINGELQR